MPINSAPTNSAHTNSVRAPAAGRGRPTGTAERFSARVRSRRRRSAATVVAAVVVVAAVGWVVLGSAWLRVREVRVLGLSRVPEASVRLVADRELDRPIVLVDLASLESAVARVPLVRAAEVTRAWPGTLVVTVHERVPVAAVPAPDGRVSLVDVDGVEVERVSTRPAGLPLLDVSVAGGSGADALAAALTVLRGLPAPVTQRLRGIGATSADGVWLTLAGGARVVWGDAQDGDRKGRALIALLAAAPNARAYDVSAPDAPAVSRR